MNKAYLGLGSNMGDKKRYLYDAIQILNHHEQIMITTLSSLYETAPWGYVDQDIFMNLVVEIEPDRPIRSKIPLAITVSSGIS